VCERNNIFIQFNAGIKHKILLYFYSLSCYLSSGISTVSDSLKNIIINKLNIKRTRISTIYNYVSKVSNKIRYDETFVDDAKIYFIGRFEPQKNIPLLINAFNRLQDSYGYQSLHLIGDGSLSKLIQSNVKNYKFHKKIYFHGYSKDPFKLVSNNSILVLPSLYEGFPNVILEAMSVGMVVVSSDCETGPSEIISNKDNGFLFKNNDLDDLIYLLKSIIDGSYDLNAVSKKAIAKANQFSSYRMMSSYDNLINGCIDQKFKV
jgi:glycosyltransferase involved in cell wall biosynthesis